MDKLVSLEKVKAFWRSQIQDNAKWEHNKKLVIALGLFGGSIFLMRNFGDAMAV
uniref:Uncharacterized protein n=1 Tax=Kalanchoe fedtschenkoi TaxID=63787 RepID=A0A7N0TP10_KALFE